MRTRFIIAITCSLALGACHSAPRTSTTNPATLEVTGPPTVEYSDYNSPLTTKEISSDSAATELKYRVLGSFPNPFFCDPDEYPVARAGEPGELARQHLPELQSNQEEFMAILKHNGLSPLSAYTDEQALLIYRDHKKLGAIHLEPAGDAYRFQLRIRDSKQQSFLVKGTVDSSGAVKEQEREPSLATCPVCLAPQTQIDTPKGPVAVLDLHVGDAVWTADASGARLAAAIVKTVRVPVPSNHRMVHVVLADGRELWSSPGHKTVDERTIGDLKTGDFLSGGRIARIEEGAYNQSSTYDLLPSGPTGNYWANGILIGSTLANARQ